MAHPFDPAQTHQLLHVLVAPEGQLSGDGQLRELLQERREHLGPGAQLWYLSAALTQELDLASGAQEAVASVDPAVITWLELRFGGRCKATVLALATLEQRATGLPPHAPKAALALS
jgi:hypothetical protein